MYQGDIKHEDKACMSIPNHASPCSSTSMQHGVWHTDDLLYLERSRGREKEIQKMRKMQSSVVWTPKPLLTLSLPLISKVAFALRPQTVAKSGHCTATATIPYPRPACAYSCAGLCLLSNNSRLHLVPKSLLLNLQTKPLGHRQPDLTVTVTTILYSIFFFSSFFF